MMYPNRSHNIITKTLYVFFATKKNQEEIFLRKIEMCNIILLRRRFENSFLERFDEDLGEWLNELIKQ